MKALHTSRLVRGMDWLQDRMETAAERRRLAALDDRMLHDLGLSRATAAAEADKPFWRE